jgi:hypothetical protein
VLISGDADNSLLWRRIEAEEMPPEQPLSVGERATLRDWIAHGASWGTPEIDRCRYSSDSRAGYDWWSLQMPRRPAVPNLPERSDEAIQRWSRNAIDRFIVQSLIERGLTPSPEADRRTLIRRLTFDLLGLPPTPEEVEAFERDEASDAYERLVDRLLASPQYGVRWARHWLDVVRFGESNGFEFDEFRSSAWPYRDWVVEALNGDLTYDEFARLQIAGESTTVGLSGHGMYGSRLLLEGLASAHRDVGHVSPGLASRRCGGAHRCRQPLALALLAATPGS